MPIPQFGVPLEKCQQRPGAYAVISNDVGKILIVITKNGRYHLPGGGLDAGEDAETALRREVKEETGYDVASLAYLGAANQFLDTPLGPVNKQATYFVGSISGGSPADSKEEDHVVSWVSTQDFLSSSAHDFHKWAVRQYVRVSLFDRSTRK